MSKELTSVIVSSSRELTSRIDSASQELTSRIAPTVYLVGKIDTTETIGSEIKSSITLDGKIEETG